MKKYLCSGAQNDSKISTLRLKSSFPLYVSFLYAFMSFNFLVQTLILYLFCQWKYEKKTSPKISLLPWSPKTAKLQDSCEFLEHLGYITLPVVSKGLMSLKWRSSWYHFIISRRPRSADLWSTVYRAPNSVVRIYFGLLFWLISFSNYKCCSPVVIITSADFFDGTIPSKIILPFPTDS